MTIRFTTTDRSTGHKVVIEAPSAAEYVKDGKRHVKPRENEVSNVKAILKATSAHGMRGGCLT